MEKIDFKKKDKQLYSPKRKPVILEVPELKFVSVSGIGNPNDENGDYQKSMAILYGICWTIKMSKNKPINIPGYHDYAIPPLEGLWDIEQQEISDTGIKKKEKLRWISILRLPDFVDNAIFEWAKASLKEKHNDIDFSNTKFLVFKEGLCGQIMHEGSFDSETETINTLMDFINEQGYTLDFDLENYRYHHEIYLNDFRKTAPENLKTLIRYPIKQLGEKF